MEKVLKILFVVLVIFFIGIAVFLLVTGNDDSKENITNTVTTGKLNDVNNEILSNEGEYPKFRGEVAEFNGDSMIVKPIEEKNVKNILGDKVFISLGEDNDMLYFEGEEILVTYTGDVAESYPVQINVISIEVEYEYRTRIEDLPEEYVLEDAISDNCIINVHGNEIYNKPEFDRFIENVEKDVPDFIRVIDYTIEGDMIITDIIFEGSNSFRVCRDTTRDKFSTEEDRTYKEYRYSDLEIEEDKEMEMYYLEEPIEGDLDKMCILGIDKNVKVIE